MNKDKVLFVSLIIIALFFAGCNPNNQDFINTSQENKTFSIIEVQDFNSSLCSSSSEINGGYDYIGLQILAYDFESNQTVETLRTSFNFPEQDQGSGGSSNDKFSCYLTNSSFPISVDIVAKDYIPIENMDIGSFNVGKMYVLKIPMIKKSSCYFDENNLETYYENIEKEFGLTKDQYSIKCMDSDISRGGFIKAQGNLSSGNEFSLYNSWGWCSSGGADCGWTKCFSVEENDELFEMIRNNICLEISSIAYNNSAICIGSAFDNTTEIREKCLDGKFEELVGNKRVISIVQSSNRCSSLVEKGNLDCLNN